MLGKNLRVFDMVWLDEGAGDVLISVRASGSQCHHPEGLLWGPEPDSVRSTACIDDTLPHVRYVASVRL